MLYNLEIQGIYNGIMNKCNRLIFEILVKNTLLTMGVVMETHFQVITLYY